MQGHTDFWGQACFEDYFDQKKRERYFFRIVQFICSILERMKFRQVGGKSRFHNLAFNKPKRQEPQASGLQSQIIKSAASFQQITPSYPDSIRSSYRRSNLNKVSKAELVNRKMSKQAIKKMQRHQTEPTLTSNSKNIIKLKQYIRSIAKTCNTIQKRYTCQNKDDNQRRQENKRFMLRHLSFFEIDEEKINLHRNYLDQMKQLHTSSSKMASAKVIDIGFKKEEEKLMQSFKSIDKIYAVLQQMDSLGYTLRTNKYLISFCTEKKLWLIPIFLNESKDKKDAFSIKIKWFICPAASEAKSRFSNFISKAQKIDLTVITSDLEDLLDHIQAAFAHKKVQQISNVEGYVESRIKKRKEQGNLGLQKLRISKYNNENFDFCKNLNQIQQKYGAMRQITKVSRCRFEDLNKTYEKLYGLI